MCHVGMRNSWSSDRRRLPERGFPGWGYLPSLHGPGQRGRKLGLYVLLECTLLVRPIFNEGGPDGKYERSTNPGELAAAVLDCIGPGARIINLSLALVRPSRRADRALESALDHAMLRGIVVVAAAGNQKSVVSTVITRHPWVIPTAACNREGLPSAYSNIGLSIGVRGLRAPGVISSRADGQSFPSSGTSGAAPFVTGTIALLWSIFPSATAQQVRRAVTMATVRRVSVVPSLLDAWTAYETLAIQYRGDSTL